MELGRSIVLPPTLQGCSLYSSDTRYKRTANEEVTTVPMTDQTQAGQAPEAARPPQTPQEAPLLLGRYRIVEQCGGGGFGRVLVCWDTRLQRRVAIKVIPLRMGMPEGSAASTVKEALAEARTSSLLAHPNIVAVYDFESDGHYAYLVMEYVDGLNLAELLGRVEGGCLTYEECAHLLSSVGDALEFAHENGVLHLDIKPSNIMIDRSGIVKLADFGMSTLASAAGYGGARGGTVGFMPPEQIQGMLVDERTDIFSLGVVLWLSLCGTNPFQADTPEASLAKIMKGAHLSLAQNHLELGQDIELVLERCLEPDPQVRMSSVELLEKRLVPILGDPAEGQASLRSLVLQAEDELSDEDSWTERYLEKTPVAERFPWLAQASVRTVTALLAGACAWRLLPAAGLAGTSALAGCAAVAAGSAIWAPLGSLAVLLLFLWDVARAGVTQLSVPLIALAGAAGIFWWQACGRKQKLGSASLLVSFALGEPLAAAPLSGFALPPLSAAVTAVAAGLFCQMADVAVAAGFHARTVVEALMALAADPAEWLQLAGFAAAALVASAIGHGHAGWRAGLGQGLGAAILIIFQPLAAGVENTDIWAAADMRSAAIAIILSVVMCISSALVGSSAYEPEG